MTDGEMLKHARKALDEVFPAGRVRAGEFTDFTQSMNRSNSPPVGPKGTKVRS